MATFQKKYKISSSEMIFLLACLAAIGPVTIDTYLPGMPAIAEQFSVTSALVEQSVSAYFAGLACGQLFFGPLSDRFGRRPVLLGGLLVYLIATLVCVFAASVGELVLARLAQGVGASATVVAGRAVIRDVWSGRRAARALSLIMLISAFAPLLAPILGGQIFNYFGWRPIFGVMLAFGLYLTAMVVFRLPETNGPGQRGDVRIMTFILSYGQVLKNVRAWSYILAGGLSMATMFAFITGSPFVYIEYFGVDPRYFGLLFGLNVGGMIAGNWINSRLVVRRGYVRMLGAGVCVSLTGVLIFAFCAWTLWGGLWAVALALLLACAPVGMIAANAIAGLLNIFPEQAGSASAVFGTLQYGFGAAGGVLVGVFHTGTPLALAWSMGLLSIGAFLAWLPLAAKTRLAASKSK